MKLINGFDIDGVISVGIYPGKDDVIITGRSFEEIEETNQLLLNKEIFNEAYFNDVIFEQKTRKSSGYHKAMTIKKLEKDNIKIVNFFEDDPIQAALIEKFCPTVNVIRVIHDLTERENVRHLNDF